MKSKKSAQVAVGALTYILVILAFLSNVAAVVLGYLSSTDTTGKSTCVYLKFVCAVVTTSIARLINASNFHLA